MENESQDREKLDRILRAVEKDQQTRWVEIVTTVLLSLATIITSWCVYESTQWSGEQYFRIEDTNITDRQRMTMVMQANQKRIAHVNLFMKYTEATINGDEQVAMYLRDRFPPELEAAMVTWEKTDPLNNSSAPATPFYMNEYALQEETQAQEFAEQAEIFRKSAGEADTIADNYVLLTIFLSVVLFLSGLAGVIDSYPRQKFLLGLSTIIFLVTLINLFRLPVLL